MNQKEWFQKKKKQRGNKAEEKRQKTKSMWSVKPPEEEPGLSETVSHQYIFRSCFALGIIGMLVITWLSEDNVTILNYENKVIDKYEIWENSWMNGKASLRRGN